MLEKLSTSQKLKLLEQLWESIRTDDKDLPIPDEHKKILNKRLESITDESLLSLDELKLIF